jgi:hypothetical protein
MSSNFQKDGGRWIRGNYMKLVEEKEWEAIFFRLGVGEAKL